MHEQLASDWDVVVVGGGLAGLAAAATARAGGGRVLLLDPHPLGGRARCDGRDGFVLNRGPRALYLGGPGRTVLEDLGVDVTRGGPPPAHGARIAGAGGLHRAPDGPGGLVRTTALTLREKVALGRALASVPRLDAAALVGTTVAAWLDQLRLRGTPRQVAEAYLRLATYVDASERLDAGAAVANLQLALGAGVRYLDGGWQSLVDPLAQRGGFEVAAVGASSVAPDPDGATVLVTTSQGVLRARSAVLAVGTPAAAAALLGGGGDDLTRLGPPVTAACLELGLRRQPDHPFVIGIDEPTYVSAHAPAARLAPPGCALVHVLRYHRVGAPTDADADRQLLWRAAAAAGIAPDDVVVDRFLARMVVTGAVPDAATGGLAGRPRVVDERRPGILLAGDWVGDRGLLADAALSSGQQAGRHAADRSATMAVP